jgi:hypothetical protein
MVFAGLGLRLGVLRRRRDITAGARGPVIVEVIVGVRGGAARGPSIINPIPTGFAVVGTTFVMATVTKNYVPPIATQFIGTTPLTRPFNRPARNATATT